MKYPSVKTLLRDLSCVQDNTESARLSLNLLAESLNRQKSPENNVQGFCREFTDAVRASRPGNTLLMHLLDFFESDLGVRCSREAGCTGRDAMASLEEKIAQMDRYGKFLAENGLAHVSEGDTIVVLQSDKVTEEILIRAGTELGVNFRVVLLDHWGEGARRAGEVLASAGIDAFVLPPGSDPLASAHGPVRLFLGGMPVTADGKILAPRGTAGLVDRFRSAQMKIFFFATSLWFSTQPASAFQAAPGGTGDRAMDPGRQDMVSLALVDHIVTEFGEVGADGRLVTPPVSLARLKAGAQGAGELVSGETARRAMSAA